MLHAGVMELADVLDSKSCGSDTVSVRPRPPAPKKNDQPRVGLSFLSRWPEREPIPTFFLEKMSQCPQSF